MNGVRWTIEKVPPGSPELVDRTGSRTVATTDPATRRVCLSEALGGRFEVTVLIHELAHCVMVSYGLIDEIRRMTYPAYWVEMEEFVCNVIADHGERIYQVAYQVVGYDALRSLPDEMARLVA